MNSDRDFSRRSDIDLVVRGIPARDFFLISGEAAYLTDFRLDIIPYEDANDLIREAVRERGFCYEKRCNDNDSYKERS